jgi:16S rRNA (adenine1518-N6/adenine1519-N6)-dimethyltransferase
MHAPTDRPRARKRFGQHFLEPVWAKKVVDAIAPDASDLFLEIGPGAGAITAPLAERALAVVACEVDRDLAATLQTHGWQNVHVLTGDFLTMPAHMLEKALAEAAAGAPSVRVAGNLPYNVASPIMFRLLALYGAGLRVSDATIMLQREVADRLVAEPNTREYGVLSVLVRHRATVERLLELPPGAFRPAPKVRSTVVRLRFHPPAPPVDDPAVFQTLVTALFSRRRKTLGNALQAYPGLTAADSRRLLSDLQLTSTRRPETMYIDELVTLCNAVSRECRVRQHKTDYVL